MITAFNIRKIEVHSHPDPALGVQIQHELKLNKPNVTQIKTPFGETNVMRVEYTLHIQYINPTMGYMIFEGSLDHYGLQDTDVSKWYENTKDVKINQMKNEASNAIMQNILPVAMMISSHVGLPPAIQLPIIMFGEVPKTQKNDDISYR